MVGARLDSAGNGALNGDVLTLAVWGGNVYVGGAFTNAAGTQQADYIARWNGSGWSALGSDASDGALKGDVFEIVVTGFAIYVGGDFLNAAGVATADFLALAIVPATVVGCWIQWGG